MKTIRGLTEPRFAQDSPAESRQRLSLATESARIGIWDWDVVANRLIWDARMYRLYGIREQDFSGAVDAWQRGLHPEERARCEAEAAAAVAEGKGFHSEFRVVWPNGEVHDIEAHSVSLRAADGTATRMIGVNWDITERRRFERAVARAGAAGASAARRAHRRLEVRPFLSTATACTCTGSPSCRRASSSRSCLAPDAIACSTSSIISGRLDAS